MNDPLTTLPESDGRSLFTERKRSLDAGNRNGKQDALRFVSSSSGIQFTNCVFSKLPRQSTSRVSTEVHADDLVPGKDDQLHQNVAVRGRNEGNIWCHDEVSGMITATE